jgi:hypothetical protein
MKVIRDGGTAAADLATIVAYTTAMGKEMKKVTAYKDCRMITYETADATDAKKDGAAKAIGDYSTANYDINVDTGLKAGGTKEKSDDFMTLVWKSNTKIGIGYQNIPATGAATKAFVVFWLCPGVADFKKHRSGT